MTHTEMVVELRRQLQTGEAVVAQYQAVIQDMEAKMADMHRQASYDVLAYTLYEATANAYREALDLSKSNITEMAAVSPTLTDAEYGTAMAVQLPPAPRRHHTGTRYQENCAICGRMAFEICNSCGGCARCCNGR